MAIAGLDPSAQVLGIDYLELPGHGYDLITIFDSLHDIGDPRGALARARAASAKTAPASPKPLTVTCSHRPMKSSYRHQCCAAARV